MINSIRIDNFKKFRSLELDLRSPITLIYGENSSGKTSSIRALLGLMQTFSPNNKYQTWNAQGELVDLGLYKDYIRDHNTKEKFSISIRSPEYLPFNFKYKRGAKHKHETEHKFTYEYDGITNQARLHSFTEATYAENISEIVGVSDKYELESLTDEWVSIRITRLRTRSYYHYHLDSRVVIGMLNAGEYDPEIIERYDLQPNQPLEVNFEQKFDVSIKGDESKATFSRRRLKIYPFERAINTTEKLLSRIFYLGPLRMSPFRSYKIASHTADVGSTGDKTPLALSYLHKRALADKTKNKIHQARYDNFLKWFDMLFPGYEIAVEQHEDVVRLKIKTNGRADSISDVGFGFSQALPILVQAATMSPGDTLIIEQPELHLHPKAQVAFANFLTAATQSGVKFIIETHSEHILKGLQLQISKSHLHSDSDGLSPNGVKIYYFHRGDEVSEMKLNQWGEIEGGWPDGFFDESYKISSEIVRNKISSLNSNRQPSDKGENSK